MSTTIPSSTAQTPTTPHEAADALFAAMDALQVLLDRETALVRAGHLREARPLEQEKSDLARRYYEAVRHVDAFGRTFAETAPALLADLRQRHERFRTLLQGNLTVLATAHAVSEGIMRGVAAELTRKTSPQVYGAGGRPAHADGRTTQPLTVSRSL
jgi:hypothetical protein